MAKTQLIFEPTRRVTIVDVEIAGDVLRIVLDGLPELNATNAYDALLELRREHEDFRRFVVGPPRGNEAINACLLLPPYSADAARTAVIAPQFGYAPIAGTPLMAAAAALIETGQVSAIEPETRVLFDTAKGKAQIIATIKNGRCVTLRWATESPKLVAHNQQIRLANDHAVPVTIISPGLPYAVVRARDLQVEFTNLDALGAATVLLCEALREQLSVEQIGMSEDATDYHVMIVGDPSFGTSGQTACVAAACVSSNGWVWSTPAGTGALSVSRYFLESGDLQPGQILNVVSPTGFAFQCSLNQEVAAVEASATVIALSELILDSR